MGLAAGVAAASVAVGCWWAADSAADKGGNGAAAEGTESAACPPENNTTQALLQCLLWRHEHGDSGFGDETQQPTNEADDDAMEHLRRLARITTKPRRNLEILSKRFQQQVLDWTGTGTGMPRIYLLNGGDWDRVCDFTQVTLGYRYSLEHWLHHLLIGNTASLTQNIDDADYLYLPHCATGVFMHIVARDEFRAQKETPLALKRRRRLAPNITNEWLVYEGNLPKKAVATLNDQYLTTLIQQSWAGADEFKACERRPTCRFLVVSIYGRHVWRSLAGLLGERAVWLTHSGLSGWLRQQKPSLFLGGLGREWTGRSSCRSACEVHCVNDPPTVLQEDLVLPWIVAFQWTPRSQRFAERDILAFYSGTSNSCSRTELERVFGSGFQAEILGAAPTIAGRRGRAARRVLVFPPEFRLLQQEWSELAFRSRLCLVPDGDSPNTGRLIEVIMHGCVPLIISDRLQPPFHEYVNWPSIAFFVREASIPDLPQLLGSLATPQGAQEVEAKHKLLEQAAHVFDYDRDVVASVVLISLRERARRMQDASTEALAS